MKIIVVEFFPSISTHPARLKLVRVGNQCSIIVMTVSIIWKCRNECLWKGHMVTVMRVSAVALDSLTEEYQWMCILNKTKYMSTILLRVIPTKHGLLLWLSLRKLHKTG